MATYIQGVTGYLPQIQAFKPNFNFYNKALQMKQSKYDAAHEKLSNMYGSLLNAPMLKDKNIEARDQFFKTIEQDIHKMSGLDLSKQQNVDAASDLFNQLLDDDKIVKDMAWTRNWQNQFKRAESFRNCINPEKCGGSWWEGGVQALNYKAQEFKEASDDQAMRMENARFTPYQNVMEKAIKLAEKTGLSSKKDWLQDGYIVTEKNGSQIIKPLSDLFMGTLGKDPAIMDYFKTKSYVERKNWIQSNIPVYGSTEAAEAAYYNQMTSVLKPSIEHTKSEIQYKTESKSSAKKNLEERIRNEGTTYEGTLAEQYRLLNQIESQYNETKDVVNDAYGQINIAKQNGYSKASLEYLDGVMATYSLSEEIGKAAVTLAFKDHEFSMKADPYSLEGYKQANRIALENLRAYNKSLIEKYKFDAEQAEIVTAAKGNPEENIPIPVDNIEGGYSVENLGKDGEVKILNETRKEVTSDISAYEKDVTHKFISLTQMQSQLENGRGVASDDLINFADAVIQNIDAKDVNFTGEGQSSLSELIQSATNSKSIGNLKEKWNSLSKAQKLNFIQDYNFESVVQNLNGVAIDDIYNNVVDKSLDMSNDYNRAYKGLYLKSVWDEINMLNKDGKTIRNSIKKKNAILEDLNEWQKKDALRVVQESKTLTDNGLYFEALIDPNTGFIKSKEQFAKDYATKYVETLPEFKTRKVDVLPDPDPLGIKFDRLTDISENNTQKVKVDKDQEWKTAYQKALNVYDDEYTSSELTTGDYIKLSLAPSGMLASSLTSISKLKNKGIVSLWKSFYSERMKPEGAITELGLIGHDSKAVRGLKFDVVDPASYLSEGYMNTSAFIKNALSVSGEDMRIEINDFQGSIPENTSEDAKVILKQVYQDLITNMSKKDKNRPIMSVTYTDIAGKNPDWTALNVKLNSQYVNRFKGTKKLPGIMHSFFNTLQREGFTVYLRKNIADNPFRNAVKKSALNSTFYYSGKHDFDGYPEITKDLQLKAISGGYLLKGNVVIGVNNKTGKPIIKPVHTKYFGESGEADLDKIISDWEEKLKIIYDNYQKVNAQNSENLIKDPNQLL